MKLRLPDFTKAFEPWKYWPGILDSVGSENATSRTMNAVYDQRKPDVIAEGLAQGIKLVHCKTIRKGMPYNGVTIAYRKTEDSRNNRMVEVAVAYCSKYDTFIKKRGAELAMQRFLNGETVTIPARFYKSDVEMLNKLTYLFWGHMYQETGIW